VCHLSVKYHLTGIAFDTRHKMLTASWFDIFLVGLIGSASHCFLSVISWRTSDSILLTIAKICYLFCRNVIIFIGIQTRDIIAFENYEWLHSLEMFSLSRYMAKPDWSGILLVVPETSKNDNIAVTSNITLWTAIVVYLCSEHRSRTQTVKCQINAQSLNCCCIELCSITCFSVVTVITDLLMRLLWLFCSLLTLDKSETKGEIDSLTRLSSRRDPFDVALLIWSAIG